MPELFELNPEKIEIGLTIRRLAQPFRVVHELRPPQQEDWLAYDKSLATAIEDVEEGGTRIVDSSLAAACALWDSIALSVQGYGPETPADWKRLVSPQHKKAAVIVLMDVGIPKAPAPPDAEMDVGIPNPEAESPAESPSLFLSSDQEIVCIRAVRDREYPQLVHCFKAPSVGQRIAYDRCLADSYTVRGTKSGRDRVVIPSRLAQFIRFYDELILSVEGYCSNGEPVPARTNDKDLRIPNLMDAQHKRASVQLLFGGAESVEATAS